MIELVEKREPINLVTLTNILRDRGELETVGGAIYLAKLIDEVPLAVNAGHYAKIIHDKRPRLSDLRESGSLEQDADVVAFIHREEVYKKNEEKIPFEGKAEIIITKQRNGPTDSLPLAFLKSYTRFENLAFDEY